MKSEDDGKGGKCSSTCNSLDKWTDAYADKTSFESPNTAETVPLTEPSCKAYELEITLEITVCKQPVLLQKNWCMERPAKAHTTTTAHEPAFLQNFRIEAENQSWAS